MDRDKQQTGNWHIKFGGWEYRILWTVGILLGFGLVLIFDLGYYSTSHAMTGAYLTAILKFIFAAVFGVLIAMCLRLLKPYHLYITGVVILGLSIVLLFLTALYGVEVNYARRWLEIFGIRFQPVEIFKVSIAIALAGFLASGVKDKENGSFLFITRLMFIPVLIAGLILIYTQPNHSAVITILFAIFIILLLSRLHWKIVIGISLIAVLAVGVLIMQSPEKRNRITAFFSKNKAEQSYTVSGERYQVQRALEVIALSGWFGHGIGKSVYKYSIPAASTDFIFAIIIEEFGFAGGAILLLCYLYLVFCALSVSSSETNQFLRLTGVGATLFLMLNVIVHVGVNLDLVPTTGINLPFISQGGSALLFNLVAVGLILNLARRRDYNLQ